MQVERGIKKYAVALAVMSEFSSTFTPLVKSGAVTRRNVKMDELK